MIRVGIVGGTGYTGVELLRLLAVHPQAELRAITSRKEAGTPVAEMFPSLRGLPQLAELKYSDAAQADLKGCEVVFFATPHGVAMAQARELAGSGVKIIDLAADFRLKDPAEFERWYKMPHACPDLLAESVYGLPEMHRAAIAKARIVGNPGCYPTAIQLGFLPLVEAGIVDPAHLIADAKSGVSLKHLFSYLSKGLMCNKRKLSDQIMFIISITKMVAGITARRRLRCSSRRCMKYITPRPA